ncbi:MAG TPA: pyridoxal phosphate-dependent aminotransferase [Candidatus Eisenbacteria bacterium]|nr:pyridoxal phosphate-dependent aminotransferase [Candidatus Eisenbacteria bacterium]
MNRRLPERQEPNRLARLLEGKRRAGRHVLDLTVTNPTTVGFAPLAANLIDRLSSPALASYEPLPAGLGAARSAVAEQLSTLDRRVAPERVFLTASSSEAYAHLFRLLCDGGDRIAVPRPSYPLLEPIARLEDVRLDRYRLAFDGRWRLDLDSLEAAVGPRTRALVVVEPNNPTGSVLSADERLAVEDLAARHGIAIISDEVFREFPWRAGTTLPSWVGTERTPTFVLGGISKSCGLPQLKLGWIALDGPANAIRQYASGLEWILDLFLSVGTPVQFLLPHLLEERDTFQTELLGRLRSNLGMWREWGARNGAAVLDADGGWSAMVRFDSVAAAGRDPAEWALEQTDVLLHPAHFYDLDDDRHVVTSLIVKPAELAEALLRLTHGMKSLREA